MRIEFLPVVRDDDLRGLRLDPPLLDKYSGVDAEFDRQAGDEAAEPRKLERGESGDVRRGEGRHGAVAEVEQDGVVAVEGHVLRHVHCRQCRQERRAVPVEDPQEAVLPDARRESAALWDHVELRTN